MPTILLLLAAGLSQAPAGDNPLDAAARALGRRGLGTAPVPATSPTRFRPSGSRLSVDRFLDAFLDEPAEREAVGESLLQSMEDYEQAAAGTKAQADASAALAYAVSVLWSTATGKGLDDAAFRALTGRFQAAFDTPELRAATDLQKQEVYEKALCSAGLVQTVARAVDSPADQARLRTLARRRLIALVGAELDRIDLEGPRVSIRGTEPAPAPVVEPPPAAPAAALPGLAAGFSYTTPSGWVSDAGWQVFRTSGPLGATAACLRLPPATAAPANPGAALRDLWLKEVPKELADRYSTMIYRRRIGDGLLAYFICGAGREAGRKADTLFGVHLVVCGAQWQPLIVALTLDPTAEAVPAATAYLASAARAESFLAGFRCPAVRGRGFASRESLLGEYGFGTQADLDGVTSGALEGPPVDVGGTLSLRADGRFEYEFEGDPEDAAALRVHPGSDEGRWSVEGDQLVLAPDAGAPRRYRIAGLTQFTAGAKVAVLVSRLDLPIQGATLGSRADWFSTKLK